MTKRRERREINAQDDWNSTHTLGSFRRHDSEFAVVVATCGFGAYSLACHARYLESHHDSDSSLAYQSYY